MTTFPLQFSAPSVIPESEATRMVPSVTLNGHGRIHRIKVEDAPLLQVLKKDHVEVEVEYCGMNFTDNYLRLGIIRNYDFPVIMGSECCGVVTRVGLAVKDLKPGQRVLCLKMMGGLFRRIVHVPRNSCFPVPDGLSLRDAIGFGINYLVAHVCLIELGCLKPDDVVFVQSVAGGVGTAITELAKTQRNVEILGTASESKFDELLSHGVKHVFGHNENYVQEVLKVYPDGVDLIINSNGGPDIYECFKMLKRCGTLILLGSNSTAIYPRTTVWGLMRPTWDAQTVSSAELINKNHTVAGVNIGLLLDTHPDTMQAMVSKIFNLRFCGRIEPPRIHSVLPFEQVADGMGQLCERKNYGKIILELRQKPATVEEPDQPAAVAEAVQSLVEGVEAIAVEEEGQDGDRQGPKQEAAMGEAVAAGKESASETAAAATAPQQVDAPEQPQEKTAAEMPKDASEPQ